MLLLLMMIEGYTSSAVGFFLPSCLLIFCGCVFNTTLPPRNSYLTFVLFGTYLRLFRVIVRYMFVSFPPFLHRSRTMFSKSVSQEQTQMYSMIDNPLPEQNQSRLECLF